MLLLKILSPCPIFRYNMRYLVFVQTIGTSPPSIVSFKPSGKFKGDRVKRTFTSLFNRGDGFQLYHSFGGDRNDCGRSFVSG